MIGPPPWEEAPEPQAPVHSSKATDETGPKALGIRSVTRALDPAYETYCEISDVREDRVGYVVCHASGP